MPILDLQVRMRELGRIRTGEQVDAGRGRKRPAKLGTFRLTTASRPLLDAAAALYQGEVREWESPAGKQWELVTQVDALPIVIPPGQALSQWMELWTGGGCARRCDGETNLITDEPCLCPKDPAERRELAKNGEACKPTTRLNVILPEIPDLGVWRLESHGYYAAVELAGTAQFLALASARGMNIPARLRLDQREKKVPGKPTNRYAVPVIELATTRIADLLMAAQPELPVLGDGTGMAPAALAPGKPARTKAERTERPALGPPPAVPDGSDFRRPAAAKPAPVEAPATAAAPAGWTVEGTDAPAAPAAETGSFLAGDAAPDAAAARPTFAETIRDSARASGMQGPITEPQKERLVKALAGVDGADRVAGVDLLYGHGVHKTLSAAQAEAILRAADSMEPEAFVAAWRAMLEAEAVPA